MLSHLPLLITALLVATFVMAACHDVVARTLPNWIAIAVFILGLLQQIVFGTSVTALLVGVNVLILAVLLWHFRFLGGGDAKLIAASCMVVAPDQVGNLLLAVTLAGGALGLLYLALSKLIRRPAAGSRRGYLRRILKAEAWRIHRRSSLPYATAIAAGSVFTLMFS